MSSHVIDNRTQQSCRVNTHTRIGCRERHSRHNPYIGKVERLRTMVELANEQPHVEDASWHYEVHLLQGDDEIAFVVQTEQVDGIKKVDDVATVYLPDSEMQVTDEHAHYHAGLVDTLEWAEYTVTLVQ